MFDHKLIPNDDKTDSNCLYYGLPDNQLQELQRVLNYYARLVLCQHQFCHVTPLLQELHWLQFRSRIEFKLLLIIV